MDSEKESVNDPQPVICCSPSCFFGGCSCKTCPPAWGCNQNTGQCVAPYDEKLES